MEIRRLVIDYLRPAHGFYVQDLGSVHGTHLKVGKDQGEVIRKGQSYLIGTDIYFNVLDLTSPLNPAYIFSKSQRVITTYPDFMDYLAKEA